MSGLRLRFILALVLFLSWLGWLAVAVWQKDTASVLSRARMLAASHAVVVEIRWDQEPAGPSTRATVVEWLQWEGAEPPAGATIEIGNLSQARPAASSQLVPPGTYLALLRPDNTGYRLVGLPRSVGYEGNEASLPILYPWNPATQAQWERLKPDFTIKK